MHYHPSHIVSFETAKILKDKARMPKPYIEGPIDNITDPGMKLSFVAVDTYYDKDGNKIQCHQPGYDMLYDETYKKTYGAIHKTYYLTYAPNLHCALEWLKNFNNVTIKLKNETDISDTLRRYEILMTYYEKNRIFAIKLMIDGKDGNEALEKCIALLFEKYSCEIFFTVDLMKSVLETYPDAELYIPDITLYKWQKFSDDNTWVTVPGYASIVQMDGLLYTKESNTCGSNILEKNNAKIMHIKL